MQAEALACFNSRVDAARDMGLLPAPCDIGCGLDVQTCHRHEDAPNTKVKMKVCSASMVVPGKVPGISTGVAGSGPKKCAGDG